LAKGNSVFQILLKQRDIALSLSGIWQILKNYRNPKDFVGHFLIKL